MTLPELFVNSPTPGSASPLTTLNGAISTTPAANTQETWTFNGAPPAGLAKAGQFRFVVDSEILLDITGGGGTSRTVLRGQEGSTVATHANGSNVWHYLTASALTIAAATGGFPTATVTVAANNAPAVLQQAASFLCDGTTDQVEINAAIASLPAGGGTVVLSEGTFNISAPIVFQKDNSALLGFARGTTIITQSVGFSGAAMITCNQDGLGSGIRPCQYIEVGNFTLDGAQRGTQSTTDGIVFKAFRSRLHDVLVHDVNGAGVRVRGVTAAERLAQGGTNADWSTYGTELDDLKIYQCGNTGVTFDAASTDAGIGKCEIFNNAGPGVYVTSVINWIGPRMYIFQNFDQSVAGGSLQGAGILFTTTTGRTVIVGNKIEQNRAGIAFLGGSGFMVIANQFTANSNGGNNTVTGFTPALPAGWIIAGANNVKSDIELIGSGGAPTSVLIEGNMIQPNVGGAYAADASKYAVSFTSGTEVVIRGNDLEAGLTGTVNNGVGGGNIVSVGENVGTYVTEASGTATIASGNTSVTVTHGLAFAPALGDISVVLTNNPTADPGTFWIASVGSTTFTINCKVNPSTSGAIFGWNVGTHRFS